VTRRLQDKSLPQLPVSVSTPRYGRRQTATGIVHLGPGAFHRAHQAWYVERLLTQDPRWGICGDYLRSRDVRDALA
jgi:fructuronate reductase